MDTYQKKWVEANSNQENKVALLHFVFKYFTKVLFPIVSVSWFLIEEFLSKVNQVEVLFLVFSASFLVFCAVTLFFFTVLSCDCIVISDVIELRYFNDFRKHIKMCKYDIASKITNALGPVHVLFLVSEICFLYWFLLRHGLLGKISFACILLGNILFGISSWVCYSCCAGLVKNYINPTTVALTGIHENN